MRVPSKTRADLAARRVAPQAGFTIIELLITATLFLVVLGALGNLLVSSTRAYQVNAARSEALQDSEAVLQLMRYEIALAGYRGVTAATYDRAFTFGEPETVVVERTAGGDEVTIRYFEDRYLDPDPASTDTGERSVTFRVNTDTQSLERVERRVGGVTSNELLVGNVASLEVLELVGPTRVRFSIAGALATPPVVPESLAGLNFLVTFADRTEWQFLIGLSNPQLFDVVPAP